ncbi:MAG: WD40 repeat domain-containing protein [Thermoguttaceae bacterium]|nr:WD40 repeat domain-containing protein [Thermoguttaceae bacterium]MDW8079655.1 WD40 repeat domain-containing protein [Thermoguttaceae bacterium]
MRSRYRRTTVLFISAFWLGGIGLLCGGKPLPVQPAAVVRDDSAAERDRAPVLSAVAIDPSGSFLATGGDDHLVRIWDAHSLKLLARLEGHTDWVNAVAFVRGSNRLVTAGQDGRVMLWDLAQLSRSGWLGGGTVVCRLDDAVRSLAISPDGQLVAVGTFAGVIGVYSVNSLQAVRSLAGSSPDVRALSFSPDGQLLLAGGRDGRLRKWSTASWQVEGDLVGHRGRIRAIAFSPDGRQLASAGEDRQVLLWNVAESRPVAVFAQPTVVASLCWFGSDRLCVGGTDNVIRILRLPEGQEAGRLVGHTGTVTGIVCRPEVMQLFSISYDTTIRVWSAEARENVALLPR